MSSIFGIRQGYLGSGQFRLLLVKARYQARLPENFHREKSAYCAVFLE